ncbi:MAG: hypothetical protein FD163_813 [Hyphomonadaceae bacterium]|nr:MAG: hypothetical protein FD128_1837 [Hyphomonadaceae bacterium]KAF0186145.1 MAG: hypothetical protein FD163_813 [Hyphomonadaceae bacterium]
MSETNIETALEAIYQSLRDDNLEIDDRIKELKAALKAENKSEAIVDAEKLANNNRQGRKLMQSYFKKRGVIVKFA